MKLLSLLFFLLMFITVSFPQNYKQVKIPLSKITDMQSIASLGIDIEGSEYTKDNNLILFVSDQDLTLLTANGFTYQVIIDDWYSYYNALPKLNDLEKQQALRESKDNYNVSGFGYGSMGGFYTYQEIGANLDSMYAHYPNLITQKAVIGTTAGGRPIWSVKISDNPNVSENEARSGFDGLIHAREPASMSTLMYFMWYLLENYGTDPEVTYLVNNREIFCTPIFNPDGYEYNRSTNPTGGGMWRKNRSLNSGSYGVDLNRNFTYMWGYDNSGSSPTPSSESYRGPSAGSELETQALMNYIKTKNIKTYLNMHAFQDAFLYPWGYIDTPIPSVPDMERYTEFCNDMTALNGFTYGTGSQVLGYNSNGCSRDWYYGDVTTKNKIFGYTMEIGSQSDGFWPTQSRIFPIAQKSVKSLMYNAFVAGDYIKLKSVAYSKPYISPGDTIAATPRYRNKGLATSKSTLSVTAASLSSYLTFIDNGTWIDSIGAGQEANTMFPVGLKISSSCPIGTTIKIVYEVKDNPQIVTRDTVSFIVGVPSFSFRDTTNDPLVLWTIAASPATPKWEATTSTFNTAPNCYTDSKTGNYANNATVTMTMTNQLNLALPSNPYLTFWTKYDLESGFDYSQVEASTDNGGTWSALPGNYTVPGSGTFQPAGQPLYNGGRLSWVKEEINLGAYNNKSIKLRFKLRTDGGTPKDGWYVDDIGIYYYSATPVELTSFTADVIGDAVQLNWQTATELNNKGFEVQKLNLKSNSGWSTLAFINGNGTTTENQKYQYTDKTEAGRYYYRIKQVDFNGSYRIYNQVEVDFNSKLSYSLSANYPNPFNPATVIKYSVPEKGNVELTVYDVLGNKAASLVNEVKEQGSYSVNFNASNLTSGVYFYTIKAGKFTKTMKMIYLK